MCNFLFFFFLKKLFDFFFLNLNKKIRFLIFFFFFFDIFFMNNSFLYAYLAYQNVSLLLSDFYSGDQKLSGLFDITTFSPMGPVESDHFSRLAFLPDILPHTIARIVIIIYPHPKSIHFYFFYF